MIKLNSKIKIITRILVCAFIFLFFILIKQVDANSINSIDMDIYIDKNGNAEVTEIWKANLTQGTEGYRPYINMGNSKISNFSVSDETGRKYTTLSNWRTNGSFDSKAYKCGYNYVNGGVELCWGISNYGNKTYTLKYNISNFVTQYTDKQGIYINLLNLEQYISQAKIIIHSDYEFSLGNARIWAFGNDGKINFVDGNIVLDSCGALASSQYMVALVRLESNLFDTNNKSYKSFDDIYDSAMSDVFDSSYTDSNSTDDYNEIPNVVMPGIIILAVLLGTIFNPIIWLIVVVIIINVKGKNTNLGRSFGKLDFGATGKSLPSDSEIEYWREVPCDKDLERAYWVSYQYNVVSTEALKKGIIGAILLKWIKEGKITVSKTRKGLFNFRDNNYAIDFNNMISAENTIENKLLEILKSASGSNNILEAKEFEKWCKKNYNKLENWFSNFLTQEQIELEKQGLITSTTEETQGFFGRTITRTVKNVGTELYNDAVKLKGLKKFLLEYSLIPQREYLQVHIWEEYLIFAQLLGIADKVEEQFSKIYPNFKEQSVLNIEVTTIAIRGMVDIGFKGVEAGRERANRRRYEHDYSGNDRDSGSGGSSYSSGGGSAGGSSGGGFR